MPTFDEVLDQLNSGKPVWSSFAVALLPALHHIVREARSSGDGANLRLQNAIDVLQDPTVAVAEKVANNAGTRPGEEAAAAFHRAVGRAAALTCSAGVAAAFDGFELDLETAYRWAVRFAAAMGFPAPKPFHQTSGDGPTVILAGLDDRQRLEPWLGQKLAAWIAGAAYPRNHGKDPHREPRACLSTWTAHFLDPATSPADQSEVRMPVALVGGADGGGIILDFVYRPQPATSAGPLILDPDGALIAVTTDMVTAVRTQWETSHAPPGTWHLALHTPAETASAAPPDGPDQHPGFLFGQAVSGPSLSGAVRAVFETTRWHLPLDNDLLVIAGVDDTDVGVVSRLTPMDGVDAKVTAWRRLHPKGRILVPTASHPTLTEGMTVIVRATVNELVSAVSFGVRAALVAYIDLEPGFPPPLDQTLLSTTKTATADEPDVTEALWIEPALIDTTTHTDPDATTPAGRRDTPDPPMRRITFAELMHALADPAIRLPEDHPGRPIGRPTKAERVYQITAAPGQGKTTLARHLHRQLRDLANNHEGLGPPLHWPVTISASEFTSDNIQEVIAEHFATRLQQLVDKPIRATKRKVDLTDALTGGRIRQPTSGWLADTAIRNAVLIVDAVDQAGNGVTNLAAIADDRQPDDRYWAGTILFIGRPDTRDRLPVDRVLGIAPLTRLQAVNLIDDYLTQALKTPNGNTAIAKQLTESLSTRDLITNPMLTTMVAWWYSEQTRG